MQVCFVVVYRRLCDENELLLSSPPTFPVSDTASLPLRTQIADTHVTRLSDSDVIVGRA